MRKKGVMLWMSVLLAAGCLLGCGGTGGGKGAEPAQSDSTADGQGDTSAQEDTGEGKASDDGDVKLKFWCDENETEVFQELIDKFIAEHKGEANIEVECEVVGASECKDVFLADVANGADVFNIPDDQLLTMVASGVLEGVANGDEVAARNMERAVAAASVDGKLYAYPISADNGFFLYYDKDYFTESDVQTLDRILEVCEENGKKFVMDWSSGWYLYSFFGNTGLTLSLNEDGLTNNCDWNAAEGDIKGVDIAKSLLDIAKSPGFLSAGDFGTQALEGDAIAVVSGVFDLDSIEQAFGDDYGACKLPTYTCAGQQVQMASFTGYRLLGVNSYSEHREWAEKLADYLSNEECQTLRFERSQRGPSNIAAASSDAVQQVSAIVAVQEQAEFGVLQKIGQKYWDPMTSFGNTMAAGNPNNIALQDLMDQMVSGITEQ